MHIWVYTSVGYRYRNCDSIAGISTAVAITVPPICDTDTKCDSIAIRCSTSTAVLVLQYYCSTTAVLKNRYCSTLIFGTAVLSDIPNPTTKIKGGGEKILKKNETMIKE